MNLPRYEQTQTYRWNYEHPPRPVELDVPSVAGTWNFVGLPVASPLGISAGPLLNGAWCLFYATLGFDVLTYKTVRSVARECYSLPNLVPVKCRTLTGDEHQIAASGCMDGSWAVSFGMPSADPEFWRRDIERTREKLPRGKLLNVSVVGTFQQGWSLDDLADDYARCAAWAVDSGADSIETNLSCPNVATRDGQLFQNPDDAGIVVRRVREAIGKIPYIVKIGHITSRSVAKHLLEAIAPSVDAIAMTNSVSAKVVDETGQPLFNGERRGICGAATREASLKQVEMFAELLHENRSNVQLIGGGGVSTAEDVRRYLDCGAHAVHMATSAMLNPAICLEIKRHLTGAANDPRTMFEPS